LNNFYFQFLKMVLIENILVRPHLKMTLLSRELAKLRGLFQKFPASYIKKHNTTTVTSLFFYTLSANFNALVPSFLQPLYVSLVEEFILPLKKDLHRCNDVIVSLSLEKCVPLKCSFSSGNKQKSDGARAGEYSG